jgi:hypothetical protein
MTDLILYDGFTRFVDSTFLFCRLGFGSFVDKVVMPYVSTVPRKLEEPCEGCAAPYGFKHHMRLRYVRVHRAQEAGGTLRGLCRPLRVQASYASQVLTYLLPGLWIRIDLMRIRIQQIS